MKIKTIVSFLYQHLLSKDAKLRLEKFVFVIAVIGFLIHLSAIWLVNGGYILSGSVSLNNPIAAIYTPFSIILFYEIYCLIYYLPKSITVYIGKQFEIITLILIRSIFEEITKLDIETLTLGDFLQQTYFIGLLCTVLILFGLIFLFYKLNQKTIRSSNTPPDTNELPERIQKYIYTKKVLAFILGIAFIFIVLSNLYNWMMENGSSAILLVESSKLATKTIFSTFFTALILSDVFILLLSFSITDEFHKVIRNSGFIISTTLLKLSFNVEGLLNLVLIVISVLFGVLLTVLYKSYKKIELFENS